MTRRKQNEKYEDREVSAFRSTDLTGEGVPARVLLAPWGDVESSNGSFVVDDESARLALDAFDDHATDLPIDYEHQTLGGTYAAPSGKAPAAGWVKRMFAETGIGLLAEIEWTEQAEELLASKEYRYLSPVAIIRKSDRKLVAIHSAALTNKPAIVGMQPIVNREQSHHIAVQMAPLQELRKELCLSENTDAEEVLAAAGRRLTELREDSKMRRVQARVEEAACAGKLVEAQRAWAEALVAQEEELFDEWLRTAPVVVVPGATRPPGGAGLTQGREQSATNRARAEFRSNPLLARLTTESAFVSDALRSHALRSTTTSRKAGNHQN